MSREYVMADIIKKVSREYVMADIIIIIMQLFPPRKSEMSFSRTISLFSFTFSVLTIHSAEVLEENTIVIIGAGIAGLATSLGLHRLGIKSVVLESSDGLRSGGFALSIWTNAWKALDAIGIGDLLRQKHIKIDRFVANSTISGLPTAVLSLNNKGTKGEHEMRSVSRKFLLETLEKELPLGTIKYSSKVVLIEDSGYFKLVHLANGTILKAKVLIGCDGVNSLVAKWLGFKKPVLVGRSSIRGFADFKNGHGFKCEFHQFQGNGVRFGFLPLDDHAVYWFFTYKTSTNVEREEEEEEDGEKIKKFVLNKLGKVPDQARAVIETTVLDSILRAELGTRPPWDLLWGSISKGNTCVAGDGLHPMTPDIGQGGCLALEDSVVLARCLGEVLLSRKSSSSEEEDEGEEGSEWKRIEMGLKKYAKERRWRSIELLSTAYLVGVIQQSDGKMLGFLRDKVLAGYLAGVLLKKAEFDCGVLSS